MARAKRILAWTGAGAGALVVLLVALALILPRVLDTESIGQSVAATLETRYHIRSERIQINLLPYPHVVIYGMRMTIPEKLTASAESLSIKPKIVPLFTGKFTPAAVYLRRPKVVVRLPEATEKTTSETSDKPLLQHFARLKDKAAQLQAAAYAALPGIEVDMDDGNLELYAGAGRLFSFEEIDLKASLHGHGIEIELACGKSDLWEALTLNGWFDPNNLKSSGELNLTGGSPGNLIRYLSPSSGRRIGDSQLDLTLMLSTDGPGKVHADFTASVPTWTVKDGAESTVMQNGSVAGTFQMGAEGVDVSLSRFRFDHPRVNVTGKYQERYADQSVSLDVEGRDTDAATVRKAALSIAKDTRAVQRIFDIVREGEVPSILFSARVKSPQELSRLENFIITGSMTNGAIYISKVDLLIKEASGDVVITGGILEGTNLSGRTKGSSTSGGQLRVGLKGGDAPFHLDLSLTADLSELPDVLKRVVRNQTFKKELTLMKDVKGKTQGRLVLGESLEAVEVKVDTGPFELSGLYERLAEPIELAGATFFMEGSKLSATGISGKSGKSDCAQVGLSYDWGPEKSLHIQSQSPSVITMDLVSPYLQRSEFWKETVNGSLKGSVHLDSVDLSGHPSDRSKWIFRGSGTVEELAFQTKHFTGPVSLKTGAFEITKEAISFEGVNAILTDSAVTISGTVTGYTGSPSSVDLSISGRLGPVGNKDAAALAGLPRSLRAISNLNLANSHLGWEKETKTTFNAEMHLPAGPRVSINLTRTPQELSIEELAIKDADSDATISYKSKQNTLQIKFSGMLSNKTADRLLTENKLLTGPVQGKFNASLYTDAPKKSTAQGQIKIAGFQLPTNFSVPARIESATLEADGNRINVKSAMISWNGSRLSLGGSVAITETAYMVDINAFADSLDLQSILDRKKEDQPNPTDEPEERISNKGWDAPVRGTIRLRSERLSYGKLTWSPANAEIAITPGAIDVNLNQANLCGISTPGKININRDGLKMAISPSAKGRDLEAALGCLFGKQHLITGSYTLKGNLAAVSDSGGGLAQNLEGDIDFTAKDGRIYRFDTFAKIFSLLGITEIYRGVLPDLVNEGCAYSTITAKGKIKDGKITLSETVVDGPCIRMVLNGEIDLAGKKIDIVALVAPLRTVDRIVGAVPVIGKLLDGALISVPVRISGDLSDPWVVPLSATAVGEQIFGFMKRTFQLPFTLFQPLIKNGETKDPPEEKEE
ncbi:MAG: AsmA-like C-terminal domain-containing protein [Syntrophobacteraceae bacterium]